MPKTGRLLMASTIFCSIFWALTGCGVRGRPQPPLTPAELGRGQPTFKRTSDEFAFPNVPSPDAVPTPTPAPTPRSKF